MVTLASLLISMVLDSDDYDDEVIFVVAEDDKALHITTSDSDAELFYRAYQLGVGKGGSASARIIKLRTSTHYFPTG